MGARALKAFAKRVLYGYQGTSESYIRELRKRGASIGEDVTIYNPRDTHIDVTAPFLLTIGDHVGMTGPITILTHDYSWSVIKGLTGEILGNEKRVTIGNNVFIGWGATVLCGTTIPDNTIIGAHAVVSGRLDGNSLWGGARAAHLLARRVSGKARCRAARGGEGLRQSVPRTPWNESS